MKQLIIIEVFTQKTGKDFTNISKKEGEKKEKEHLARLFNSRWRDSVKLLFFLCVFWQNSSTVTFSGGTKKTRKTKMIAQNEKTDKYNKPREVLKGLKNYI